MKPDTLKRFQLLAEFSKEDREALAELLEERELSGGRSAFREGVAGEGLILLSEGRLTLKSDRSGSVVGALEAPAHLGAASLFSLGKREVSAFADGPVVVQTLLRTGLPRLMDDAPRAAFRLAEAVANELAGLLRQGLGAIVESDSDTER
ncbi:MAG: hypothetical protein GY910_25825 [bacterium]|nr:hypothetical protein [bacterium]